MPTYNFRNKLTGEITEEWMNISHRESYLKDHANLEPYILDAPMFSYSGVTDFNTKTDNTWKEVLTKIAENHPASSLAETHLRRNSKQVKTKQAIDKHLTKVNKLKNG